MPTVLAELKAKLLGSDCRLSIAEACQFVRVGLAGEAIDTNDRFHHLFFNEFVPLVAIASGIDECAEIIFSAAGHGVDATLLLGDDRRSQMVEMTAAVDGQQEALQMEHLERYGHAPVTTKILATGKRNTKDRHIAETDAEWASVDEHREETSRLIADALDKKKRKAVSRQHYNDAWLGIVVPNFPPRDYRRGRFDPLCVKLLSEPAAYAPFSRVFVVSTVGDYIFDSQTLT